MAKKKKTHKDWEQVKKQLAKFSDDAMKLIHKGEKEVVRISKESKLHIDSTTLGVQKEKLYYLVGKEYIRAKCPGPQTAKLKKYIKELQDLNKKQIAIKSKITRTKRGKK